jgi:malate dehydrogenase
MAHIGILGAGNVGANTAFFLAERNIGDIILYDIDIGVATGKALDLMEAAPIRGYQYGIHPVEDPGALLETSCLVVAAGAGRQPGMRREDLYERNSDLIDTIGASLKGYEGVVVVATEPVDLMVQRLQAASGLAWSHVLGVGGVLNSTRLRHIIARRLGLTAESITATVIGRHSEHMQPLLEYTRVNGVPATVLLDEEEQAAVVQETRNAGDLIVDMSQRASSYYGPSAAVTDIVQAVIWNSHRILPVSFSWQGHYGIQGVAMSLPAVLGSSGIERVLEPQISQDVLRVLQQSAQDMQTLLAKG